MMPPELRDCDGSGRLLSVLKPEEIESIRKRVPDFPIMDPKVFSTIEALQAKNKKLVEALEKIAAMDDHKFPPRVCCAMQHIAMTALMEDNPSKHKNTPSP